MVDKTYNNFHLQIEYGEGFQEFIAKGKMPGNLVRVKVDDEFLIGGEDYYTESPIMGLTLTEAVEAAIEIDENEKAVIDFPDGGGTILIIEPRNEQTVALTPAVSDEAVMNPKKRIFDSVIVTKGAVISEIIHVAKEWRDRALNINPDIVEEDWFKDLQQAIAEAESTRKENN